MYLSILILRPDRVSGVILITKARYQKLVLSNLIALYFAHLPTAYAMSAIRLHLREYLFRISSLLQRRIVDRGTRNCDHDCDRSDLSFVLRRRIFYSREANTI